MTTAELRALGYRVGPDGIAIKIYEDQNHSLSPGPEPECPVGDDPLAEAQGEAENPRRISVCITSYRRRLIDPDNLCGKYHLDLCRYAGLIRDDSAKEIDFRITQEKVRTKEEEKTVIELDLP